MNKKITLLTVLALSTFGVSFNKDSVVNAADIAQVTAGQSGIPAMDVVDISSHNGKLSVSDFQKMKSYGIRGVIVKLTEGNYYRNPYAESQVNNARTAGMRVSAYHYSVYGDGWAAQAEANYFADYARQLGFSDQDLLVNDLEDNSTKNGGVSGSSWMFNEQLKARGFQNRALYTYTSYWNTMRLNVPFISNDRIWMASYPYNPSSSDLWNKGYGMWQWTSNAKVPGINGTFDMSIDYAGMASEKKFVQKNIDGKWYLIDDSTGQKQVGLQYLEDSKKWVLYDRKTGEMLYGQQEDEGHWYYFDTWSGAMVYGRKQVSDGNGGTKWVLYDRENGQMLYGQQKDEGHWYYFDNWNGAMRYGLQFLKDYNNWYYYDMYDGTMQYG
ncbi:1,4-beta-N-acetylmuramidase, partial [Fructobacillus sp. M1-13]